MRHFTSIKQLPDLAKALEAAKYVKEGVTTVAEMMKATYRAEEE